MTTGNIKLLIVYYENLGDVKKTEEYADQTERDHASLLAAIKEGRIQAVVDV
jgi:hypothetical protein